MNSILRFIFRLDYKHRYDLMDRQGAAMQLLTSSEADKYWTNIALNQDRSGISLAREDGDSKTRHSIALEYNNLHGECRTEQGIDLDQLLEDRVLIQFDRIVSRLTAEFELRRYERLGFRLFALGGSCESYNSAGEAFARNTYNSNFVQKLSELSRPQDCAVIFEGELPARTEYRLVTGPGGKKDRERLLGKAVKEEFPPHAFSIDLDLFERNIDLKNASLYRWVKSRYSTIQSFFAIAQELVSR